MKIIYWSIAGIFLLFAVVQYNDPDPLVWMLLYGAVAVFYALAAIGRRYRPALWAAFALVLSWAATYVPAFLDWLNMGAPSIVETMKAETPYVELTREFLGLMLAAIAFGWLASRKR